MIQLSRNEKIWIMLCKGWTLKKYSSKKYTKGKNFIDYIRPHFTEVYGWSADQFDRDFKNVVWNVLFELYMKVRSERTNDADLKEIVLAGAGMLSWDDEKDAVIRIISKVRSEITVCAVNNQDGSKRFDLEEVMPLFVQTNN